MVYKASFRTAKLTVNKKFVKKHWPHGFEFKVKDRIKDYGISPQIKDIHRGQAWVRDVPEWWPQEVIA